MQGSINFSGTLAGSVAGEGGGSNVVIVPTLYDGVKIADYSIDSVGGELYAPEVSITPTLQEGVKVADYSIDGVSGEIRVPEATDVSITPTLQEGVKVADYSIDGVEGAIYSPAIDWSGLRLTKAIQGLPAAVANITDAEAYAIQSLRFGVDAWQEGRGEPSPSNIRPIHGWSSAKVSFIRQNLFNPNYSAWETAGQYLVMRNLPNNSLMRMTLFDKDTSVDISGISLGFVYNIITNAVRYRWNINNGIIQSNMTNRSIGNDPILCNNIMIYPNTVAAFNALNRRFDIQVELDTSTSYEHYTGLTYTIDLSNTCYGGRVEIVDGVTSFIQTKGYIASYNGEIISGEWMSDRDVYQEGTSPTIGAQVVYTLATPIIIPLSNYIITTLNDYNNAFATTGVIISGDYVSNTKVVNILG